jgi:heterodisulfide reductase subunit B
MTETEQKTAAKEPEAKKFAYFPGCVIPLQLPYIEKLARDIFAKLGFEISDLDFSCCPSGGVKDIDDQEWLLTAARNISLADEQKLDVITVCTGCSQTLIEAKHEINASRDLKNEINDSLKKIDKKYKGSINTYNFMMVMDEIKDQVAELIKVPLKGLNIATHTGCHLLKPPLVIGYDNAEHPVKFDEFVEVLGANAVDYETKTLCCGASALTKNRDLSLNVMKAKIEDLNQSGADLLTMTCPTCFNQYDKNAKILKKERNLESKVPAVHILQLVGLALGMTPEEVNLKKNRSIGNDFIEKITGILQ